MSGKLRILMLEANDADAALLEQTLRAGGLSLKLGRATDRASLLKALQSNRWDLMLCDSRHDVLTARQAIDLLRHHDAQMPVIVVGDGVDAGMAVSVMHAGAHDFVSKHDLSRLVPAIERELAEQASHRRVEIALQESEQRLRQLSEHMHEVFWILDAQTGKTLYLSPSFEVLWERPVQWLHQRADFLLSTVYAEDVPLIQQVVEEGGWVALNHDYRIVLPDGAIRWINTRSFALHDQTDQPVRIAGISTDITERKQLELEKDMMARALEQSADMVMITDAQGVIVYVNSAFEDISGYRKEEVLGKRPGLLRSGFQDALFYQRVWQSLRGGLPFADVFINRRKDGELFYEAKTITPLRGKDGEITHYVSTGKDITERLKGRERLQKLLHYDAVSGLANRILLQDRLQQAVLHARRLKQRLAVVCMGLGLGQLLGEQLVPVVHEQMLRHVAERLLYVVDRETTVARIRDDDFVLVFKDLPQDDSLDKMLSALVEAFASPLEAGGYQLYVTPRLGVSRFPDDSDEVDGLLAQAEQAMAHAREQPLRNGARPRFSATAGAPSAGQ